MQLPTEKKLLIDIEAFCDRHDVKPSTFGRLALNDSGFVNRLREGRSPSLTVTRKVYAYMSRANGTRQTSESR